jgi:hypothetical protein
MNRLLLILLLSSAWAFAQAGTSPADQNQNQQPDKSQAAQSDHGHTVEGCLTGAANTFTLTDAKGRTYKLTGDTKGLNENVGHKVRLYGEAGSSGPNPFSVWGTQATFGVKKVESLASTCK